MKLLILDGTKENSTYYNSIYKSIENIFSINYDIEIIQLCSKNIAPCIGCFGCWLKKPGRCLIEDDSQEIIKKIVNSDILMFLTPVTFGGYSSDLKKLLDRCICVISPFFTKINGEMHHKKRYDKYPSILGIGFMDKTDDEQSENFKKLIYRNSLNLHAPVHCAEVILKNDDTNTIKNKISVLKDSMEVNA